MANEKTYKGILVLCEYTDKGIHRVAYELLNKGREIADKLGQPLEALVVAPENVDVTELMERGADRVYHIKGECFRVSEEILYKENVVEFIKEYSPMVCLIGATEFGRSAAPRIACALGTGLTADCTDLVVNEAGEFIQVRPAFSDNILAHIKTVTFPKFCTVRYKEFAEAGRTEGRRTESKTLEPYCTEIKGCEIVDVTDIGAKDISEADVIVAAGRGVKTKEDMAIIEALADALGGTVGASRALVDAGIASSAIQVGYSVHRVKPIVYIACGISGAPQHMAGMKESDTIIAINKDPSAPIFNIADYGIVGDLYEVVPALTRRFSRKED
ncbi:MAG: electron transfer flavoprotein subunit alpha/FixB family protein [Firmicutes bacterium]|nr:electron transfer flavoprotein subunit alpha/FixB family protein [Bacillota bacterium]